MHMLLAVKIDSLSSFNGPIVYIRVLEYPAICNYFDNILNQSHTLTDR